MLEGDLISVHENEGRKDMEVSDIIEEVDFLFGEEETCRD
jgi:hypothetical protein